MSPLIKCNRFHRTFFRAHRRPDSAPDESYSQESLLHDPIEPHERSEHRFLASPSPVRKGPRCPLVWSLCGHVVQGRTSRDTGTETPRRGPPAEPPPPPARSESLAETYLPRITCPQRNLPVGRGARSRDRRGPMPGARALGSRLLGDPPAAWVYPGR